MKIVKFCFCSAALLVMGAGQATATTFFADQFNYPDGQLTINDGTGDDVSGGLWVPHSGETFSDNIDVISGQAELLNSGSEDAHRDTGTFNAAGTTWYYAAMVTVNDRRADPANESINNDYFIHFWGPSFAFRGRTYLHDPNVASTSNFTLGLSATSGGQVVQSATDLAFGEQFKIVTSFDFDTGESKLWVNPTDINSPSVSDTNAAAIGSFVSSLAMRQDFISPGTPNNQILVDAVAIGDNFGDVLRDVMVPEPTGLMLVLAGLIGLVSIRSRQS